MSRNRLWWYGIAYAPPDVFVRLETILTAKHQIIAPCHTYHGAGRSPDETFVLLWANKAKARRLADRLTRAIGVDPKYARVAPYYDDAIERHLPVKGHHDAYVRIFSLLPELYWKRPDRPASWVTVPINWFEVEELLSGAVEDLGAYTIELFDRARRTIWFSRTQDHLDDQEYLSVNDESVLQRLLS